MCHFNIRCCCDSVRSVCCVHQRAIWTQSTVKHAFASTGLQEIDTWKAAAAMLTCDLPQGKGLMRHTDCNTNDQPATTLGTSNLLFLMCPETRNQISYCVPPGQHPAICSISANCNHPCVHGPWTFFLFQEIATILSLAFWFQMLRSLASVP